MSELLPDSGAVEARPSLAAAGKGNPGKKNEKPLLPQGAAKAQAIIAAALAEAELAVAAKRKEEPVQHDEETEEHSEEPVAEPEPAGTAVGLWI